MFLRVPKNSSYYINRMKNAFLKTFGLKKVLK